MKTFDDVLAFMQNRSEKGISKPKKNKHYNDIGEVPEYLHRITDTYTDRYRYTTKGMIAYGD